MKDPCLPVCNPHDMRTAVVIFFVLLGSNHGNVERLMRDSPSSGAAARNMKLPVGN